MSRSCFSNILSFCTLVLITCSFPASLGAQGRPDVVWMRGGHANSVRSMDYSPDGQLFVTVGDSYGKVKIWRLSDGLMLRTLSVLSQGASGADRVIFLPDSQTIAVFDGGTSLIKIVRVSDGEILRTIVTQSGTGDLDTTMKLMADGTIFIATSLSIKFYRLSDGVLLRTITRIYYRRSNGQQVDFGQIAGKSFPTSNGTIGTKIQETSGGPRYPIVISAVDGRMIGYHPREEGLNGITKDGAFIITPAGGHDVSRVYRTSDLCVVSLAAGCNPSTIPIVDSIQANGNSVFSADGQAFAMVSGVELKLFNTSNWTLRQTIPRFNVEPLVFSPDSHTLATGGEISVSVRVRLVNFWNVTDGTLQSTLNAHFNEVLSVAFSANGQTVASYSAGNSQASTTGEGTVRIWNSANGSLIREIRTGQDSNFGVGPVKLVALSPDGQSVFNAAPNSSIQIWKISDGSLLRTITTNCRGLNLSPDGQTIASINASYGIDLYRTSDGGLLRTIPLPGAPGGGILHGTRSVAFTPDGQTLIAGQLKVSPFKGFITFFRVSDGGVIRTVETLSTDVRSVAISPDGETIASAGTGGCDSCISRNTGIAELRRVSDGSLIRSFTEHAGGDVTVAFTPNGQYVCTGGGEAAIRFWSISDGTLAELYDQELPSSPQGINVETIAISGDGALFAYGRYDATLVMANNPFPGMPTPTPTPTLSPTPTPAPLVSNVQFSAALFNVSEGANGAAISVTRTGDSSTAITVDYVTSDGTAQQTRDYAVGSGTLSFVAGETSKTFGVIIIDDAYPEGSEVLNQEPSEIFQI